MQSWAATLSYYKNRRNKVGWNKGYEIFEATVVGAYDLGKLDKKMLAVLMEPYRDSDIDSGGSNSLMSKDGKGVEQIVIESWGLEMPKAPPVAYKDNPDAWEDYNDAVYQQFSVVTDHFGWR
jgi:hypothetical protein